MLKILVVEDVEDSRILLEDILLAAGYEVSSAINGLEALGKIKSSIPDLIVSDILMPEMDGFELCRQLKQEPPLKSIPFIFYTATYIDSRDEKFALALGADRFVIKPEEPEKLLKVIKEVISEAGKTRTEKNDTDSVDSNELKNAYSETLSRKLNKKVEDLERQKEQLKIITNAIPALISEIDESGHYKYVNSAYEEWFGLSCDEIVGKNIIDVVGKKWYELVQSGIEKALGGEEAVFEGYVEDAKGNNRFILARYIPSKSDKVNKYHCLSFVNDLTKQKQAEDEKHKLLTQLRQAQKMDAIGHLAGGIAHDFNNILTIILGYTELMASPGVENKKESFDDYNKQIRAAALRGQDLISQMMKITREPIEQVDFSVDIKPLIKDVVKLFEVTFPATIKIDTDIEESESLIVIELTKLHQVLVNLLVNARDAIKVHGRIHVELKHKKLHATVCDSCKKSFSGDFIALTVSDDGEGIDLNYLDKIFELFYTSKDVGKGTGIGLSMVHNIVHESRGHILINSVIGEGTSFRLFFPISDLNEKVIAQDTIKSTVNENAGLESTIMIVDDELAIVNYLDILFSQHGYKTKTFTDSEEAFDALQSEPDVYDLVVTDQTMPKMTGTEMSEKMMLIRPGIPIIICSGNLSHADEYIKTLGAKAVLQKPVTSKQLLQTVKDNLSLNERH